MSVVTNAGVKENNMGFFSKKSREQESVESQFKEAMKKLKKTNVQLSTNIAEAIKSSSDMIKQTREIKVVSQE